MRGETVGYGVIGCGVISAWHLRALTQHVKGVRVVAVADEIPERAEARAREYGIPRWYAPLEAILADPEVDAVSICTPSGLHGDMVIAASDAGKHAMTEKPIDIRLAKIDAMIAACRRNGTKLGVIFQRRTSPLWRKVRETVQAGKLGRMVLGDAFHGRRRPPRSRDYPCGLQVRPHWPAGDTVPAGAVMGQCSIALGGPVGPVGPVGQVRPVRMTIDD